MNIKINLINKIEHNLINTKYKFTKNPGNKQIPIVSTPILFYYIGENRDNYAGQVIKFLKEKGIDLPLGSTTSANNTGFSPSTKIGIKNKLEAAYKEGKITKDEYETYNNKIAFTSKNKNIPEDIDSSPTDSSNIFENIKTKFQEEMDIFSSSMGNLKEKVITTIEGIKSDIREEIDIFSSSMNNIKEKVSLSFKGNIAHKDILSNNSTDFSSEHMHLTIQDIADNPELIKNMSAEDFANIDTSMPDSLEEVLNSSDAIVPDGLIADILDTLPDGFDANSSLLKTLRSIVSDSIDMA